MHIDWILGCFFSFFGLVGNSWVIFIIAKRRRLQTTANWFILSLAVADVCVTCAYFPAVMICEVGDDVECTGDIPHIVLYFFRDVSAICLIAMIAERYIAIVHPLKYVSVLTTTRTVIIIASCWAFPFLLAICQLIYLASSGRFAAETQTFVLIHRVLFVVLPTIFVLSVQFQIIITARKLSREMQILLKQIRFNAVASSVKIVEARNVGLRTSTVSLTSVIIIIFIACYGTEIHLSICFYLYVCDPSEFERVVANLLFFANSTLNPLVYAIFKEDIKRESKALMNRMRCLNVRLFRGHSE